MDKYTELRNKHESFVYHSYSVDMSESELVFSFHFSLDNIDFFPKWVYRGTLPKNFDHRGVLEYAVFNLGMVELISYWKCACPENVYINCGSLSDYQAQWWKKLYRKGLGEFFYINNINPTDDFIKLIPKSTSLFACEKIDSNGKGVLIPVGGGKDSIVTMELLRESMKDNLCYIINPREPVIKTALIAGYKESDIIGVKRTIDARLLKLNSEGYLNGHTPFSAIVAFSSWIFALVFGKRYIALSNESSANEVNVTGTEINHQYSKSTEFEADFREYMNVVFGRYPEYFSLLRPLSEWQITRIFSNHEKYFSAFQSCNVGSKTDTWCGKCAKCLYVYIMLAAFLPDEKLISIFGADMLDNAEFRGLFDALIYPDENKPFECVGTKAEIRLALYNAYERRGDSLPYLLKSYIENNPEKPEDLINYYDENNFVPKEFLCLKD